MACCWFGGHIEGLNCDLRTAIHRAEHAVAPRKLNCQFLKIE